MPGKQLRATQFFDVGEFAATPTAGNLSGMTLGGNVASLAARAPHSKTRDANSKFT
jgi:hypothetical protein